MIDRYDEEEVLGFIEGELTHEQKVEFEKKLVDDPRLRNLVAHLVLDRHRLRHLPDEQAPPVVMDAVNQAVERHMLLGSTPGEPPAAQAIRLRFTRWAAYGGIAAMIAVVATIVFQTLYNPGVMNLAIRTHKFTGAGPESQTTVGGAQTPPLALAEKKAAEGGASGALPPPLPTIPESIGQTAAGETLHAGPSRLDESRRRSEEIAGHPSAAAGAAKPAESALAMKTEADSANDQKQRNNEKPDAAPPESLAKAEQGEETRALKLLDPKNTPAAPAAAATNTPAAIEAPDAAPKTKTAAIAQDHEGNETRQSDLQLVIVSASPAAAADQVRDWAKQNQAEVLTDRSDADTAAVEKQTPEQHADKQLPEQRRMVLILSRGQVVQLADALTRKQTNQITLMAPTRPPAAAAPTDELRDKSTGDNASGAKSAGADLPPPASQPADALAGRTGGETRIDRYLDSDRVVLPILIRAAQDTANATTPQDESTPTAEPGKK
ncbi:MAG: hypothetical protein K8S99_11945 [Planctomycetes bacterium]|nr:hypothetical protein [Planctomycetota bacterium]